MDAPRAASTARMRLTAVTRWLSLQRVSFDQVVAIVHSMYAAIWCEMKPRTLHPAVAHRWSP
jgi:hypothetical protein